MRTAPLLLILSVVLSGVFASDDAYVTLGEIEKTKFGKTLLDTI